MRSTSLRLLPTAPPVVRCTKRVLLTWASCELRTCETTMGRAPTGRREIIHRIYRVRGLRKAELKWLGYPAVCFMIHDVALPPSINTYDTYLDGGGGVWFGDICSPPIVFGLCAPYIIMHHHLTPELPAARVHQLTQVCSTAWSHGSDNNFVLLLVGGPEPRAGFAVVLVPFIRVRPSA